MTPEDAARLKELSGQLSGETLAMAKLKANCSGLQRKAADVQVGARVCAAGVVSRGTGASLKQAPPARSTPRPPRAPRPRAAA